MNEQKMVIRTIVETKLEQAFEEFRANPSSDQWRELESLMYVYQHVQKSPSFKADQFDNSTIVSLCADIRATINV